MTRIARWPRTEAEMLAVAVDWLKSQNYEVYQEVELHAGYGICDVVAVKGGRTLAIEGKRSFSLDVLGQAHGWDQAADQVAVAVPAYTLGSWRGGRRRAGPDFATAACEALGVGILALVNPEDRHGRTEPKWRVEPAMRPAVARRKLIDALHERQKDFSAAGSPNGSRVTPFTIWREAIVAYVGENPGCTARELAAMVGHHYASDTVAASQVLRWAEGFGMRIARDTRPFRIYP